MELPDYCCAILKTRDGKRLLEWRGPNARHAPGLLTCLGGARELNEEPEDCLRRELIEEIGWTPDALERCVVLHAEGVLIAWFYRAWLDCPVDDLRPMPGLRLVLLPSDRLSGWPVHPWHREVIDAEESGFDRVVIRATAPKMS